MLLYLMERASSPTKSIQSRSRVPKPAEDYVEWESVSSNEAVESCSSESEFSFEDEYFGEDWTIDGASSEDSESAIASDPLVKGERKCLLSLRY